MFPPGLVSPGFFDIIILMNNDRKTRLKNAFSVSLLPAAYSVLFLLLMALWKLFNGPSPEETYASIVQFFTIYGTPVIAISALIEGIVLVNFYFPGSAVILIGVATARGDPLRAAYLIAVVSGAFFVAAQLNYCLGLFGFRKAVLKLGGKAWLARTEKWYAQYGAKVIPLTFIHPNVGAFMSVACGNARFKFVHFAILTFFSIIVWNSFWGVFAYLFPKEVANVATQPMLLLSGFLLWTTFAFLRGWFVAPSIQIETER